MTEIGGAVSAEELTSLVCDLVRIPSVNPALSPGQGTGEAEIAAFAADWLVARGVDVRLEEVAPGRPNVVAVVGGAVDSTSRASGPTLVLCGHLDTVGVEGMDRPFEPRLDGGRLYGRGAYDMKGGVAAIMSAMVALREAELPGRVIAALVADEEHASIGADQFVQRHGGDACVLTEFSEGRLILAHKGFLWAEFETAGIAAHGSRWDVGVSAIDRMARVIAALEAYERDVLRQRVHPMVGPASMHCSRIEGGTELSVYAAGCRLSVERRLLPGESVEAAFRELEDVARSTGQPIEVRQLFHRAPMVCAPDEPVARAVRDAAQAVMGEAPAEGGVAYWMDAAIFAEAGIPAVNIGPAGAGAHAAVEWVDLDSVESCARILAEAARRFLDSGLPGGVMRG